MTTALYVVAIVAVLAYVVAYSLCRASAKPTPPPGSLQAHIDDQILRDELRAREAVRTQHTVHAEPIRQRGGGWRT
jgi:hypothetical protein